MSKQSVFARKSLMDVPKGYSGYVTLQLCSPIERSALHPTGWRLGMLLLEQWSKR